MLFPPANSTSWMIVHSNGTLYAKPSLDTHASKNFLADVLSARAWPRGTTAPEDPGI
jgi:hypothetical protein